MENLNRIRNNIKGSKKLNRRFHSVPFRKLQTIIEYKALLKGIEVRYLTKEETRNTSRTCHKCGHVARVKGRVFKCPECGMEYDRDLNACVNIARRVTSSMGWGSCEPPEPAYEAGGVKPQLNAGSLAPQGGVAHLTDSRKVLRRRADLTEATVKGPLEGVSAQGSAAVRALAADVAPGLYALPVHRSAAGVAEPERACRDRFAADGTLLCCCLGPLRLCGRRRG